VNWIFLTRYQVKLPLILILKKTRATLGHPISRILGEMAPGPRQPLFLGPRTRFCPGTSSPSEDSILKETRAAYIYARGSRGMLFKIVYHMLYHMQSWMYLPRLHTCRFYGNKSVQVSPRASASWWVTKNWRWRRRRQDARDITNDVIYDIILLEFIIILYHILYQIY
jgi:hypothetical protein